MSIIKRFISKQRNIKKKKKPDSEKFPSRQFTFSLSLTNWEKFGQKYDNHDYINEGRSLQRYGHNLTMKNEEELQLIQML